MRIRGCYDFYAKPNSELYILLISFHCYDLDILISTFYVDNSHKNINFV